MDRRRMTRKKRMKKGSVMLVLIVCGASSVPSHTPKLAQSTQLVRVRLRGGIHSRLSGMSSFSGNLGTQIIRDWGLTLGIQNLWQFASLHTWKAFVCMHEFWNLRETQPGSTGRRNSMVLNGCRRFQDGLEKEGRKQEGQKDEQKEKSSPYHEKCRRSRIYRVYMVDSNRAIGSPYSILPGVSCTLFGLTGVSLPSPC